MQRASSPFFPIAVLGLSDTLQAPIFKCMGYCRFEDRPVDVDVEVTDESTLKAAVVFKGGDVCHKN